MADQKDAAETVLEQETETVAVDVGPAPQAKKLPTKKNATAKSAEPEAPRKRKINKVVAKKTRVGRSSKPESERMSSRGTARLFPFVAFQDALTIADTLHRVGAGKKMRRLTVFDELQKSPDSGHSRQLVTNSSRYGITTGGYQADYLELTESGRIATDPDTNQTEQLKARFQLAIGSIEPFKFLYDRVVGGKLPAQSVMQDILREHGIPQDQLSECVDVFVVNAKYLGLLRNMAGAERIISLDHAIEDMPGEASSALRPVPKFSSKVGSDGAEMADRWNQTCFYISPIGSDGSDQRKHADLFLNHIIEPALEKSGLLIVRADQIAKAGMITSQVIEHILRARLVIADLSFHNPNVFYELSLRHTCGLPTVQVIRAGDRIPFDLQQYRTIEIDNSDIYSLVPKLEVYRSQVSTQVRAALEDSDATDNPIRLYFPDLTVTIPPARKP